MKVFHARGLSAVDDMDEMTGRAALALLLAGAHARHLRHGRRRRRDPADAREWLSPLRVLVAARDEEERIAETVAALRQAFPDAEVIVADDGSRDATAERAEAAGAIVLRLPRRGKGQALSAAERAAPPGRAAARGRRRPRRPHASLAK